MLINEMPKWNEKNGVYLGSGSLLMWYIHSWSYNSKTEFAVHGPWMLWNHWPSWHMG